MVGVQYGYNPIGVEVEPQCGVKFGGALLGRGHSGRDLDSDSESAVQRALARALTGRTSVVIAHRLSTIREADQILVIDAGQVVEHGSHTDLLAAGGLYAELYRTQFQGRTQVEA